MVEETEDEPSGGQMVAVDEVVMEQEVDHHCVRIIIIIIRDRTTKPY